MRKLVKAGIAGCVLLSSLVIGANWKETSPLPEITVHLDPAKVAKDDGWGVRMMAVCWSS